MNVKKRGKFFGEKVGTWLISDMLKWGRGLGGMYVCLAGFPLQVDGFGLRGVHLPR